MTENILGYFLYAGRGMVVATEGGEGGGGTVVTIDKVDGDSVAGNQYVYQAPVTINANAAQVPDPNIGRFEPARHAEAARRAANSYLEHFAPLFVSEGERDFAVPQLAPASIMASWHDIPDLRAPPPVDSGRLGIEDAVCRHPFIVLRGDPGAGKTTACHYLVSRACDRFLAAEGQGGAPLPVLVQLKALMIGDGEDPSAALERCIGRAVSVTASDAEACVLGHTLVAQAIKGSVPTMFFLDGLNEVPEASRRKAHDAIAALRERLADTCGRIVVTTRRYGFQGDALHTLDVFDVLPLSHDQIIHYISKRLNFAPADGERFYRETLGRRMKLLSSNPLLLSHLCDILSISRRKNGIAPGDVPQCRGALFRAFATLLLNRDVHGTSSQPIADMLSVLRQLATEMQSRGLRVAWSDALAWGEAVPLIKTPRNERALIEHLCAIGILKSADGALEFAHQTLQEYFCADALYFGWSGRQAVGPDQGRSLQPIADDPAWWEPLAFVGGLVAEGERDALLAEVAGKPLLKAMIIAHFPPDTRQETEFVEAVTARLGRITIGGVVVSQAFLVGGVAVLITAVFLLIAMLNTLADRATVWLALGLGPLANLSVWWGVGLSVIGLFVSFLVQDWADRVFGGTYERVVARLLRTRIEPLLHVFHTLDTDQGEAAVTALVRRLGNSRWVDPLILRRLSFSPRQLGSDPEEIAAMLGDTAMWPLAVFILALTARDDLIREVLRQHHLRSPLRQEAERELVCDWALRRPTVRSPLLMQMHALLEDGEWPYPLRRRFADALEAKGLGRFRVGGLWRHLLVKAIRWLLLPAQKVMEVLVYPINGVLQWSKFEQLGLGHRRNIVAYRLFAGMGALFPFSAMIHRNLSLWADCGCAYDAALAAARRACVLAPADPSMWVRLGNGLRGVGAFATAERALQTAVSLDPQRLDFLWEMRIDAKSAISPLMSAEYSRRRAAGHRDFTAIKMALKVLFDGDFLMTVPTSGKLDGCTGILAWALVEFGHHERAQAEVSGKLKGSLGFDVIMQGLAHGRGEALTQIPACLPGDVEDQWLFWLVLARRYLAAGALDLATDALLIGKQCNARIIAARGLDHERHALIEAELNIRRGDCAVARALLLDIPQPIIDRGTWLLLAAMVNLAADDMNFHPVGARIQAWKTGANIADLMNLPELPSTGVSPFARQACACLELRLWQRVGDGCRVSLLEGDAYRPSKGDFLRIKALLDGVPGC